MATPIRNGVLWIATAVVALYFVASYPLFADIMARYENLPLSEKTTFGLALATTLSVQVGLVVVTWLISETLSMWV